MIAGHDTRALMRAPAVRALAPDAQSLYLALCAAASPGGHVPPHIAWALLARHPRGLATLDALAGATLIDNEPGGASGVWVRLPATVADADVFLPPAEVPS